MKHIGLFEGIGGFSLAARWMGWETIAWCEWNEFGQKVLKHHFPKATPHGDITKTDFTIYAGKCDILTGGFPCQPYSAAGKRLGKEDDRHLWPEMLRAIREIQPGWVVGENVRGLTNWNGGVVFDEVQADLEAEGYEVLPFLLPACAVNAPHRRDRIWFVAYNNDTGTNIGSGIDRNRQAENEGRQGQPQPEYRTDGRDGVTAYTQNKSKRKSGGNNSGRCTDEFEPHNRDKVRNSTGSISEVRDASNTDSKRHEKQQFASIADRQKRQYCKTDFTAQPGSWSNFPTQSPICSRDDGIPGGLDGITFSKWRNESIKAYGNAIVPQVALQIFKAIEQYENSK